MKKLVTAFIAGAFAAVLAAPAVIACPGHEEGQVAKKEEKGDTSKTAEKAKSKKDSSKPDKTKVAAKKVVSQG